MVMTGCTVWKISRNSLTLCSPTEWLNVDKVAKVTWRGQRQLLLAFSRESLTPGEANCNAVRTPRHYQLSHSPIHKDTKEEDTLFSFQSLNFEKVIVCQWLLHWTPHENATKPQTRPQKKHFRPHVVSGNNLNWNYCLPSSSVSLILCLKGTHPDRQKSQFRREDIHSHSFVHSVKTFWKSDVCLAHFLLN